MALFRTIFLFSLASVVICFPTDQTLFLKTNVNGTSPVQSKSLEIPKQSDTPAQPTTTILLPITATSANRAGTIDNVHLVPSVAQAGPIGRSDADYSPEGRDLSEALSLMSTFLTPKLMQPGAASASMTPTSTGPQAGSAQQNQQPIVPQQPAGFQQPMGFGQQQPGAFQQPMVNSQFPQQQGFMNQQVPLQQNVDPRMLSFGSQPAYGQGAYQQPSSLFNQPMPYLQARGMSNSPQPLTNVNAGQQALPTQGAFNGMSAQNLPPNFNNNQQQFVPSNQQFPSGNAMQG